MNFSQGHSGTKAQFVNRACFPKEKTTEFTKKGEIHELFVLALSLVWFAGATPDFPGERSVKYKENRDVLQALSEDQVMLRAQKRTQTLHFLKHFRCPWDTLAEILGYPNFMKE